MIKTRETCKTKEKKRYEIPEKETSLKTGSSLIRSGIRLIADVYRKLLTFSNLRIQLGEYFKILLFDCVSFQLLIPKIKIEGTITFNIAGE